MKYVLQCEDSIEGIFSAVYEAWERKYGHQNTYIQVSGFEENTIELFTTYIVLTPDTQKAQKVLNTIRRTCSDMVYEYLFKAACADAADKGNAIYRYIQLALSLGNRIAGHFSDAAVARVMELSRTVGNAEHHYCGFLRFIEIPGKILLARYAPKPQLTALLMPHFTDRFPEERFVIWDTVRNVAGVHVPGQNYILLQLTKAQVKILEQYTEENMQTEQMWCKFVESISIKEKENKKLQQNNLPLHFRTYMPEFYRKGRNECQTKTEKSTDIR